jgi:predicted RecA/RadA family phage recombinase
MSTTAGAVSVVSVADTKASVSSAEATGGTAPYTHQWHRSTLAGFSPSGGTAIAGATALALSDSGLIPNTQYYYKLVSTDAGAVAATSAQLPVLTTAQSLSQNQFALSNVAGLIDLKFSSNSVAVEIDASQVAKLVPGSPVKMVNSIGGIPKVVGCAADADEVLGFINFDIKSRSFAAGDRAEISIRGNVMFMYATAAIARGAQVALDLENNGVKPLAGSGGADVVGWAYDKAAAMGDLIRVYVQTPSFLKDGV